MRRRPRARGRKKVVMPKVAANGIDIFYEFMGEGEPLAE